MSRQSIMLFTPLLMLLLTSGYFIVRSTTATRAEVHEQVIVQLEQVPAEQATRVLGQYVANSSAPEVLLSRCLCSARPVLIETTATQLLELLEAWRELPRNQAARRLCALVEQLESTVPQMSTAGRSVARQTVQRALRWPLLPGSQHTPRLLASCQRSLAALDRLSAVRSRESTKLPIRVAERAEASQPEGSPSPRMLPVAPGTGSRPLR